MYSMMLCINTPAPGLAMQEDPGLETRMPKANSEGRRLEREGTVGVREEEQRWRDGEQEGWSSPRYRIETVRNPGRSQTKTKENRRHENRDYSTKEAMWRWETVRVEGR